MCKVKMKKEFRKKGKKFKKKGDVLRVNWIVNNEWSKIKKKGLEKRKDEKVM